MPPALTADRPRIFRITHRDNVPWILKHGLHAPTGRVLDPNFRNIGNLDLIDKRAHRVVKVGPDGIKGCDGDVPTLLALSQELAAGT